MRFRKKPVVIEAWQIGCIGIAQPDWLKKAINDDVVFYRKGYKGHDGWFIETLEGTHHAADGDWIIRGVKGELYPCKPEIFALTYEEEPR